MSLNYGGWKPRPNNNSVTFSVNFSQGVTVVNYMHFCTTRGYNNGEHMHMRENRSFVSRLPIWPKMNDWTPWQFWQFTSKKSDFLSNNSQQRIWLLFSTKSGNPVPENIFSLGIFIKNIAIYVQVFLWKALKVALQKKEKAPHGASWSLPLAMIWSDRNCCGFEGKSNLAPNYSPLLKIHAP